MKYSESEIRQYVAEEDVKFLRMTFFDLTGNQKNMSILPDALDRAFSAGIAFDASARSRQDLCAKLFAGSG